MNCTLCDHPVDWHLEGEGPCMYIVRFIYGTAQNCSCPRVFTEGEE